MITRPALFSVAMVQSIPALANLSDDLALNRCTGCFAQAGNQSFSAPPSCVLLTTRLWSSASLE